MLKLKCESFLFSESEKSSVHVDVKTGLSRVVLL